MKKLIHFLPILFALMMSACEEGYSPNAIWGSGSMTSADRQAQGVRDVTLATSGDLTIALGDQESLRIEAEDNLLPYLETRISGGALTIGTRPNTSLHPTRSIRYVLTVKSLEALAISSSGNISAPALQVDHLTARISSSGNIHLDGLNADSLQVRISSNGNVEINGGEVKQQSVTVTSSGQYKGASLRSQTADVHLSSSGGATLWVTDSLNAELTSSGDMGYYGRPAISQRMSSSGRIVSLGDK